MQKNLNVHIGEVKIAKNGELLKAILGSCVGIGIIWKERKICGLAHCLLPHSPLPTFDIGARFVNQAINSLIALMKIKPADLPFITVVIAGGGNMTSPGATNPSDLVGANNFKSALQEAKKHQLSIVYAEGGGEEARRIFVDASDFSYRVERIPKILNAA